MSGMGSGICFRTSLVPSITYISVIKIGWAVFEKIWFFDFLTFVYNFCKQFFFELILGVNSSWIGSHRPSQYGSNPSGGTQTMLILLRPFITFFTIYILNVFFFLNVIIDFQHNFKLTQKISRIFVLTKPVFLTEETMWRKRDSDWFGLCLSSAVFLFQASETITYSAVQH